MKCVNCNNATFIEIKTNSTDLKLKACTKCGHVEYFYRMDKVKLFVELDSLIKQSDALEIIASNSNQSIEAQKEAEEKIDALEKKILKVQKKLNSLK